MKYPTIHIEGSILSSDILEKIEQSDILGQNPKDFGFDTNTKVKDEIAVAWADTQSYWKIYKRKIEKLKERDTGASETRQTWIVPFLGLLGYQIEKANAEILNEKTYAISHRATNYDGFPIHVMGCNEFLDKKPESGTLRMSPHALVQEYLNLTEHLYAIVTNGYQLRILRDASRLVKLSYLEFNLEQMFEEEHYSDFALMYRLIHASRMPKKMDAGAECLFEQYHQDALESGSRIREKLAYAVEIVMFNLANGFLNNPHNSSLREHVENGLAPQEFYRKIRKLVYRLLFLMVIEDRNLIYPTDSITSEIKRKREIYYDFYSIFRLRKITEFRFYSGKEFEDLWIGLLGTFRFFESGTAGQKLGISPLNGDLFSSNTIDIFESCHISNSIILDSIRKLNVFENEKRQLIRINYSALDVEELGSVYESLLELQPVISKIGNEYQFTFARGTERKTTGSYYTRHDLVQELIKSALIPVIQERLSSLPKNATIEQKVKVILSIKVCDTASGSGHFLLAAARNLGLELARIKSGEDNPSPSVLRECIREVIQHCIYGVDKNPDAVELCRIALWLEGHSAGKPLSFLEHRIKCGDSLVGVDKPERILNGIPDEAFNPVTGDDKPTCQFLKKLNKRQRTEGLQSIDFGQNEKLKLENKDFAKFLNELEELPENCPEDIYKKADYYNKIRSGAEWYKEWTACNIWTSAFFLKYTDSDDPAIPTTERLNNFLEKPTAVDGRLVGKANAIAQENSFFHWYLEFPEVFSQGGFDVILGNPPWEKIKLQEVEFFSTKDINISNALTKTEREKLIKNLPNSNLSLYETFQNSLHYSESLSKYIKFCKKFENSSSGDINTYSIFSDLDSSIINRFGRVGVIVPTGIATDDTNKHFFSDLVENNKLVSLFDFENKKALFPNVHRSTKFSLITIKGGSLNEEMLTLFAFFLHHPNDLKDERRTFTLKKSDLNLLNPKTKTCSIFRTKNDSILTHRIYLHALNVKSASNDMNKSEFIQTTMFHSMNHAHLFTSSKDLIKNGFILHGNIYQNDSDKFLPLIEGKSFNSFDHRTASVVYTDNLKRPAQPVNTLDQDYNNPNYVTIPRAWVNNQEINKWKERNFLVRNWVLAYKKITASTNERTLISSVLPIAAFVDTVHIIINNKNIAVNSICCFLGNINSIIFDFITRQKVGGTAINFYIFDQLPLLNSNAYENQDFLKICPIILELTYSSWDIKAFADDVWKEANQELKEIILNQWEENKAETGGHIWEPPEWAEIDPEGFPLPPFKWHEDRRAKLKAELDAYYAKLYQLTDEELRYILDPKDVYGEDFPSETFRVLKEKEIRKYGEYRTKRLVLEAWEKLK